MVFNWSEVFGRNTGSSASIFVYKVKMVRKDDLLVLLFAGFEERCTCLHV